MEMENSALKMARTKSIRAGNLDYRVTTDYLRKIFSQFGSIENIQLFADHVIDRYAVIVFHDEESAERAKELNGLKVGDNNIVVE